MSRKLDETDARLLNLLQEEMPLVDRPFAEIGRRLGLDEMEVLRRMQSLKDPPHAVIRQISAIFDTRALGYQSSLVAAKISPERLDEAAALINGHPGVSHNYARSHEYNLWYTLAVAPDSRFGLEKTIELLHRESGAITTRPLPTLKLYKIGVRLDVGEESSATAQSGPPRFTEEDREQAERLPVTEADKRMIRVLQQDLPIESRPYDAWATQAGVGVAELLAAAQTYQQQKRMRRFSAVLHHREAGFSANGMGIWAVPAEQQEQFGATAAGFAAVSHCYLRPTYPDWPYNLFTMVHAPTQPDCDAVLAAISRATGVRQYSALYSTREYKKVRVRYFTSEAEAWEGKRA